MRPLLRICFMAVVIAVAFASASRADDKQFTLEVFVGGVDKMGVVEPPLSPWRTEGRPIHHFRGYSESMVLDSDRWLQEHEGKVYKVILRIRNRTTTTERLPIPSLSEVVLRNKDGAKNASAFYSTNKGLVVVMEGKANEIDMAPSETVELLYYIPAFQGEARLDVMGLGTSKILEPLAKVR